MKEIDFCGDTICVAPETVDAWAALGKVLARHGYQVRTGDTDSYNCRAITGGSGRSLHSYGIALDINWNTNPYKDHPGTRDVRYSDKATQAERAEDVARGAADTDMTPGIIADVLSIKTRDGLRVFQWGGDWNTLKDTMHFQIDVSPEQLARGIDETSVGEGVLVATAGQGAAAVVGRWARYRVTARSGLRLRSGPGPEFDVARLLPNGTVVLEVGREGAWSQISLEDDGIPTGMTMSAIFSSCRKARSGWPDLRSPARG